MNVPIVEILPKKMSSSLRHFPREITPERLATHTSGLPSLPKDWNFWWNMYRHSTNPYSAYHEDNLATTLQKYRDSNPQNIGNNFAYSNLGMGLLGYALTVAMPQSGPSLKSSGPAAKTNATAVAYDQLLQEYITKPFHLNDTTVQLTDKLLPGYDRKGKITPHWTFDALAGCGALHSTLGDVLSFGVAHLRAARQSQVSTPPDDATTTPLDRAMQMCHKQHFVIEDSESVELSVGLGWIREKYKNLGSGDLTILWHNGQTYGFASFLGWEPQTGAVVVVLSNSPSVPVTTLGKRILLDAVKRKIDTAEQTTLTSTTT